MGPHFMSTIQMRKLGLILFLFIASFSAKATHISGADFNYTCIGQDSFYVTLNLFRDCSGIRAPVQASVDFSSTCGQSFNVRLTKQNGLNGTEISQLCPGSLANSTCNGGNLIGMQQHIYAGIVVLTPPCDTWTMQWSLCCRNTTVNLVGQPEMLVEATLNSATDSCNNSPVFNAQPILYVCLNQNVDYNFGITEADGDSIVYRFVTPKDQIVAGNVQSVPFAPGYSFTQPIPGITLSSTTGQLQFTPTITGNFVLAVEVCEYDYVTGLLQGCVVRDIQFIVIPCLNQAPEPPANGISSFTGSGMLLSPDSVLVCEGNTFNFNIIFTDPDVGDSVTLTTNLATVLPGATFTFTQGNPATMNISGTATANMATINSFIVDAIDDACPIPAFAIHAYTIIIQPKPIVNAGSDIIICHDQPSVNITGTVQNAAGGTWSGQGTFSQSVNTLNNTYSPTATEIAAGNAQLILTSTGNQNCDPVRDTVNIQISSFDANITPGFSPVQCSAGNDGKAFVTYTGGNAPISVSWNTNPIQLGDSATNLVAGTYIATLVDSNGCDTTIAITVPEPLEITTSVIFISNVFCKGGNDGQATVTAIGGVGPYTFTWPVSANNQTTATGINLFAGTYIVTVTDSNSCYTTQQVIITEPNYPMNVSVNTTGVLCFGDANGTATANPTGGTAPYNYTWGPNGQTTNPIINLSAGTYSVTVIDNSGMCVVQTGIQVTEPMKLSGTNSSTDVLCFGESTGIAAFSPTGGTPQYSYQWGVAAGSAVTSSVANLAGGQYPIIIIDANGCVLDTSVIVGEPNALGFNTSSTMVSCNSGGDGQAIVTPLGGVGPYAVSWNTAPIQLGDTAINLTSGPYVATIMDSNGCDTNVTVSVFQPTILSGSIVSQNNVNCTGGFDGEVTVTGIGGSSPYSYVWGANANNQTTATIDSLFAGNYSVTITDSLGCTTSLNVTISQPFYPLVVNVNATDITCNGNTDGTITVLASGGTAPYQYNWAPSGFLGATISNLGVGVNTVTVTDNSGQCLVQTGIAINEPSPLSTTVSIVDVNCFGESSGSALVSTFGGIAPYSFTWDAAAGSQTDSTVNSLSVGTYSFSITDSNGCAYDSLITLNEPTAISISSLPIMPLCYNGTDGQILALGSGGIAPYTYAWDAAAGSQTDSLAINLSTGFYTVTLTDSNSCTQDSTFFVDEPLPVSTSSVVLEPVGCYGDSSGTANIVGAGGTYPYVYQWNTSANLELSGWVFDLWAGNYSVTITDSNGCQFDTNIIITQPAAPLSIDSSITNVGCFGDSTGAIEGLPAGGTAPYTFVWDSLANNQTTAIATNLAIGSYQVIVTDSNGCLDSLIAVVDQPQFPLSADLLTSDVLCFGDSSGYGVANGLGGTTPYVYQWGASASNQLGDTAQNLAFGPHLVRVTDSNGCVFDTSIMMNQPLELVINNTMINNVSCFGDASGTAEINVLGGIQPYSYQWSASAGSQTDSIATNLLQGMHLVSVVDSNGCDLDSLISITQPIAPLLLDSNVVSVLCFGESNGVAVAIPSGGTAPYNFVWNGFGVNSDSLTSISAGSYTVLVNDSLGCLDTIEIVVNEPNLLMLNEVDNTPVNCFGGNDGMATVNASGGTGPYQYQWPFLANYQTDTTALNLSNGSYTVMVTDSNGCNANTTVVITQPQLALTNTVTTLDALCNGDSNGWATSTVIGGTTPYAYQWSGGVQNSMGDSLTVLSQGSYMVTITDSNACQTIDTFQINEPNVLQVASIGSQMVRCFAGNTGTGTISGTGGTFPYTYTWGVGTGAQTSSSATGLATGTYFVTLTDMNGCTVDTNVFVNQPANALNAMATFNAVNCFGGNDGQITASISGGTNPYGIQWGANTGSQTSLVVNNLTAGTYQAIVTDGNGCLDTINVNLTQPNSALVTQGTPSNVSCYGFSDGQAAVNISGGTTPYVINWDANTGNQTGLTANNLLSNSYNAYVTDANGCADTHTVTINEPRPITLLGQPDDTVCIQANFNLDIQVFGGNGGYNYIWNNGLSNSNFHVATTTNSNTYIVSVTDALGCPGASDTINITVHQIELDSLEVWKDGDICAGETAKLFASYNGTFGTYSFQWSNGLGTGTGPILVSPTQSTIYQVTVTDQCQTSVTDFIVVNVLQAPVVNIPSIIEEGCGPLTVLFEDQVADSGTFSYLWSFGDGTTSASDSPTHTFTNPGTYQITVVKTGLNGCPGQQSGPSVVTVNPTPVADGIPNKYVTDITSPTIQFTDQSIGAVAIRWDFSPIDFSTDLVTNYTYPDPGVYPVYLKAVNQFGCESTHEFEVEVVNESKIKVPNAFIPNGNGGNGGTYDAASLSNEVFYARLASVTSFEMQIFNRWGELIFESKDVNIGWDGYYRGELSAQDVYVWKISVVFEDGSQISDVGNLTLIQ